MFQLFLLGIALMVGLYFLGRAFLDADPKVVARVVRYGGLGLAVVVVVFLAVTGRLGTAIGIAAFLFPLFLRWRRLMRRMGVASNGASPGQQSELETDYLAMTLDHETGVMEGVVRRGRYEGRRLDQLGLEELLDLLAECAATDPQSAAVLEAYLDRTQGADWRTRTGAGAGADESSRRSGAGPGAGGPMTREEAYQILGLEPGAGPDEIKDAHRRLMLKLHPDQGGRPTLRPRSIRPRIFF